MIEGILDHYPVTKFDCEKISTRYSVGWQFVNLILARSGANTIKPNSDERSDFGSD
jgi:hypothetical protein